MRLSAVLFLCVFLFACTGVLDNACRRLRFRPGRVAALCLLLAALSGFLLPLIGTARWSPASLLLVLFASLLARRGREALAGLGIALFSGALAWVLLRFLPQGMARALPMAVPAVLAALCFPRKRYAALTAALLSPLITELAWSVEEWALFGYLEPVLGGGDALDAQAVALVLLAAAWSAPVRQRQNGAGNSARRVVS